MFTGHMGETVQLFLWWLLQLCLHTVGSTVQLLCRILKSVHGVFFFVSQVFAYLHGTCLHFHWLQECTLKDSLFVFGGNSLGVQTSALSSLVLTPSTPFVLFIFHACSLATLPPHHLHPPSTPACLSLFPPSAPSPLILYQLVLAKSESRAFCCKGEYFWGQVTHALHVSRANEGTLQYT